MAALWRRPETSSDLPALRVEMRAQRRAEIKRNHHRASRSNAARSRREGDYGTLLCAVAANDRPQCCQCRQ